MGILLALLVATNGIQQIRIANWKADYSALQANLDIAAANEQTLKAAIKSQTDSFLALQAEQRNRDAAKRAEVKKALSANPTAPIDATPEAMNQWMRGLYGF